MKTILLKLEIKLVGKRGHVDDFLTSLNSDLGIKRKARNTIQATVFVNDEAEFLKIYTPTNRALINWIRVHKPDSVYAMAKALKKDVSNLSKVLRSLARFSLVRLEEGATTRRTLTPFVDWNRLEVLFPSHSGSGSRRAAQLSFPELKRSIGLSK